jgi:nucleotide-binding universal stress UspA family protein
MALVYSFEDPEKNETMNRILFATDYSFSADKAFEYALEIAGATQAELVLMHAFPMNDLSSESYDMKHDDAHEHLNNLVEIARKDPRFAGLKYTVAAFAMGAAEGIKEAVKLYSPELIVMGTRGATGAPAFFNASVGKAVLAAVHVPLMLVPEESDISNFRNFVLAADYVPLQDGTLDVLKEVSEALKANISIVHVGDSPADLTMIESAEGVRLDRFFGEEVKHRFQFVQDEDVLNGLEVYLEQKADAGVLVMVNHERHDWLEKLLLPSHTARLIRTSRIPVLVLKD